jgi:hypothetical protein
MAKITQLDKQWRELMFLCERESTFRQEGIHPKLLSLVSPQIEILARQMGFGDAQIQTREFRAERDGDHIVSIVRGS